MSRFTIGELHLILPYNTVLATSFFKLNACVSFLELTLQLFPEALLTQNANISILPSALELKSNIILGRIASGAKSRVSSRSYSRFCASVFYPLLKNSGVDMKNCFWLLLLLPFMVGCVQSDKQKSQKESSVTATAKTKVEVKKEAEKEEERKVELPDDITTATFDQLIYVAVQWEVGSYIEIVRKAKAELRRRGKAVLPDIIKSMPYSGGLAARAYDDYFKSLGEDALQPLSELLASKNDKVVSNAIDIIYSIRFKAAIPHLRKLLKSETFGVKCSRILAYLGDKEVIPTLTAEYRTAEELSKLSILRALMALKEIKLAPFYINECGNKMVSIRRLAQNALVSLKKEAVPTLVASLKSPDVFRHRNILETLGRIGEPECIVLLIEELKSPDWRYRFSATRALGYCKKTLTEEHKANIKKCYDVEKDEVCRRELTRLLTEELPWRTKDLAK